MYQIVMYQYPGAYNPLSLSLNKKDASSSGDVKQICFAEVSAEKEFHP